MQKLTTAVKEGPISLTRPILDKCDGDGVTLTLIK